MNTHDSPPRFPEEDDGFTRGGRSAPAGAWLLSLASLALMLMAGAFVFA